jgi:hypothetical protein
MGKEEKKEESSGSDRFWDLCIDLVPKQVSLTDHIDSPTVRFYRCPYNLDQDHTVTSTPL